jgi:hypothetical protein
MEANNSPSNDQFFNNRYNHIATTMEDHIGSNQNINMNIVTHYDMPSPTENRKITHENKIQDLIDNPSKNKTYVNFSNKIFIKKF